MALSNWDCISFGPGGVSRVARFDSARFPGVHIDIYKNWLYLYDPKAGHLNPCYTPPCIAEIRSGDLRYQDMQIFANSVPLQQSIWCFVVARDLSDKDKKTFVYGGIGCYGFDGSGVFTGVHKDNFEQWLGWAQEKAEGLWYAQNETVKFFNEIVNQGANVLRYNQGDHYLAERVGRITPKSQIGEADVPGIMKITQKRSQNEG